jgi:hypothetical protein
MGWTEVFKNELYKNDNGCYLKKESGEFVLFDQDGQRIRIPIKDILENPIHKYTTAWYELKSVVDNIAENSGALYNSIIVKEDIPPFAPINLNGKLADSYLLSLIDGTCQGISIVNVPLNMMGQFQVSGIIQNPLWNFVENQPVFLNGISLSQIRPETGFLQRIGIAKTPDTLILKISEPVRL